MKVNKTSAKSSETEIKTSELNSKIITTINFDLISQTIKNARKQSTETTGNEKPSNTRRESFFDKASYIAVYLKHATWTMTTKTIVTKSLESGSEPTR